MALPPTTTSYTLSWVNAVRSFVTTTSTLPPPTTSDYELLKQHIDYILESKPGSRNVLATIFTDPSTRLTSPPAPPALTEELRLFQTSESSLASLAAELKELKASLPASGTPSKGAASTKPPPPKPSAPASSPSRPSSSTAQAPAIPSLVIKQAAASTSDCDAIFAVKRAPAEIVSYLNAALVDSPHQITLSAARWTAENSLVVTGSPDTTAHHLNAASRFISDNLAPFLSTEHSSPHDEKTLTISSLNCAVAPVDIGPAAASVQPSFLPLAPEVETRDVLDVPFTSLPTASSFQTDLAHQPQRWAGQHLYSSLSPEDPRGYMPAQESWEYDYPLAEAFGDGAFHLGELERRPVHRRQSRYEQSAYRIEGQDSRFMCTVGNCGKTFSGEWEKQRHIRSMHPPLLMGCRLCSYKQSRMDLFSEHCKKRHPAEPIEELKVQLEVPDA